MYKYNSSLALSKPHYPYEGSNIRQKHLNQKNIEWKSSCGMKYMDLNIQASDFDRCL